MRILVTGGARFLGSEYVRMLLGGARTELIPIVLTMRDKLTYSGNLRNLRCAIEKGGVDVAGHEGVHVGGRKLCRTT